MSEGEAMKIGITGTIGSGKSSVSSYLRDKGFQVYDADKMVHALYAENDELKTWLVEEFGKDILNDKKEVNRQKLADFIFEDSTVLEKLESIVFPLVNKQINEIESIKEQKNIYFEVPLLFEAGMAENFDIIITVDAEKEIRHKRLNLRGLTSRDIKRREKRQWTAQEKAAQADYTILNNGSLEDLFKEVNSILERV